MKQNPLRFVPSLITSSQLKTRTQSSMVDRLNILVLLLLFTIESLVNWGLRKNWLIDNIHVVAQIRQSPKSRFGMFQIVIWCIIPNRDLVHYPESRFGISQIVIWYIIPNYNLGYPKSKLGISQIIIWNIIPNRDLGHYSKSQYGIFLNPNY